MSKEMMIVFIYDAECCKNEEDDPALAVLYFHPNWVSDVQRLALVGQLMGTTHFLSSIFSTPRLITLESGKFALRQFGRYILAVGTDRNIADWIIEHRTNILTSLLSLYHCSFDSVHQITISSNSENQQSTKQFKEKLYQIFETYLPILQYSGSTFCNAPSMQLPKSASNVFLEAIEILECCQDIQGVLGGAIFYHNKIVATQINIDITKMLVMTDPYRIKCTAETVKIPFELPNGVQLLQVYINRKEYYRLKGLMEKYQEAFENNANKKFKKSFSAKSTITTKEPVISAMKRDKSIIFSTVPEEDSEHTPTVVEQTNQTPKQKLIERPRSLSLFTTTADMISADPLRIDKKKPHTPFRSQASVCSTPLADKVLHGNVMSICSNPEYNEATNGVDKQYSTTLNKNENVLKKIFNIKNPVNLKQLKTNLTTFSRKISVKYNRLGFKTMPGTPAGEKQDLEEENENIKNKMHHSSTITDPSFPIFGQNGLPISKSLYEQQVIENLESIQSDLKEHRDIDSEGNHFFKNFDSESKDEVNKSESNGINNHSKLIELTDDLKKRRHSLNLPLKSLTLNDDNSSKTMIISPTTSRQSLGGVQLTPLLSKLTTLAMDEKSSGIGSQETTPGEFHDFSSFLSDKNLMQRKKNKDGNSSLNDELIEENDTFDLILNDNEEVEKVSLFICGQQNTVAMILLENKNLETLLKLWEICYNSLSSLESNLHQCIDPCSGAATDLGMDPYSYMSLDQKWDILQRGGPWGVSELSVITQLHKDFMDSKNLCEIIVRNDDGIVYGYRHSQMELFYHQNSSINAGLPTPADLMGTVPLKAKRRLERDHAIILL